MKKKQDPKDLEQMLRRRGDRQTPVVKPSVTEIRSCGVCGDPEPLPLPTNKPGLLGGVVIIWEFTLEYEQAAQFNEFLRNNESFLFDAVPKLAPAGKGCYLGTYSLWAGGTPRYRTLWAYESLDVMMQMWQQASGNVVNIVTQLRAYWLSDPNRTEARWIPAQSTLDPKKQHGDAFALMTLKAAKVRITE